ncbi:MAG: glutamate 5-kinase [Nitrosomonadales bacterium]|jgi:glutamate 5-kinase|nr:glutamate 5-kinase [Nitrosomonadales bacterium]MBT4183062.1 glutamate 5-kinase [Nitrosomonadales bacterium]MBT4571364.1 glutamate 5-kinase [Nitrosomonadales bacterium]MBT4759235.1 glutamate 5-kinase [Nitrosomonadales bacterium]MBT5150403.1 glutamate 5-kinase [Nitrosomonadales bacterium]
MKKLKFSESKKIVIKVGTSTITNNVGFDKEFLIKLSSEVTRWIDSGVGVVIVSSGAIFAGLKRLEVITKPSALSELQAAAAVGQMDLAQVYKDVFMQNNKIAAQVLLTHDDLSDRKRYLNARSTINNLIGRGVVPIINENDTVSTDEIRFGDNDNLAAMVANLIEADYLLLLTDQEGLFSDDPTIDQNASLIEKAFTDDKKLDLLAKKTASTYGTGGMVTKIEAARRASLSGTHTIIANGKINETLFKIFNDKSVGTFLESRLEKKLAKKKWLADNLRTCGRLILDKGASIAILEKGKSLLPVGVLEVEGKFERGEVVVCIDHMGMEIAKGLVNYSSDESKKICGISSNEIESVLGFVNEVNIIHRDNLVVL